MRWPSDNLIARIRELNLCERKDIERCARHLRGLGSEIPDFDCVWTDALVNDSCLTAFQADQLLSDHYQGLLCGSLLLKDQLGPQKFLAIDPDSQQLFVIDREPLGVARPDAAKARIDSLERKLREVDRLPHGVANPDSIRIWTGPDGSKYLEAETKYQDGWTTQELLVRGGRLPWNVVRDIGLQLLSMVRQLDERGLVHGDIRTQNLQLQADRVRLNSPFFRRLLYPTQTFSSEESIDRIATTAPELIATGQSPTAQSDLFSVGAVLWQLLTHRPICPSHDPVICLQQIQNINLPDARSLVPDCPPQLAEGLQKLTQRRPEVRDAAVDTIVNDWQRLHAARSGSISRLVGQMPERSRSKSRRSKSGSPAVVMAMSFAVCLSAVAIGWQQGLLPESLSMVSAERSNTARTALDENAVQTVTAQTQPGGLMPLPDSAGVVVLASGQTYEARNLSFDGDLFIETSGETAAIVRLTSGAPWNLRARRVSLYGVQIESSANIGQLVNVESNLLSINRCRFGSQKRPQQASCVVWSSAAASGSVVLVKDSVFAGNSYAVDLESLPGRCELKNVLARNCSLLKLHVDRSQSDWSASLNQVTQLGAAGVVDVVDDTSGRKDFLLRFDCGNSVLAPRDSLVRWAGSPEWQPEATRIEWLLPERGNPTVVPPQRSTATYLDRNLNQLVAFSDDQLHPQALMVAALQFQGQTTATASDADVELLDYEGPKLNTIMPGISLQQLPKPAQAENASATSLSDPPQP